MNFGRLFFKCALLACLLPAGCNNGIGLRKSDFAETTESYNRVSIKGNRLSGATRNFLNSHFWQEQFRIDPDSIISATEMRFRVNRDRRYLEYLIDMCRYCADESSDEKAIRYYTSSCYFAYLYLFEPSVVPEAPRFSPGYFLAMSYYNEGLTSIMRFLQQNKLQFRDSFSLPMAVGGRMNFSAPLYKLPLALTDYSSFLICSDFMPVNLQTYTHSSGVGVPMISVCAKGNDKYALKVMPGQTFPLTVLLRFGPIKGDFIEARLEYYSTTETEKVKIGDIDAPLQLDFSTPLAYMLQAPPPVSGIFLFLNPYRGKQIEGLYSLTPFQENKIPVVFVHGLLSNPRTWAQMINTLMGDPLIRRHCQFWFFAYPTGNPIIYSAKLLRQSLLDVEKQVEPTFRKNDFSKMVVVAHSMGGLLSKTLIQNSGDALIKQMSGQSEKAIMERLTPEQQEFVRSLLIFKRLPFVQRVVFLATPHYGSEIAAWMIVRYFSGWVTLPQMLQEDARKILVRARIKRPDEIVYMKTGLDNLEPDDPMLNALSRIKFDPTVPFSSVIGNEEQAGCPGNSDGVVPYSSAHLDGACSELVVKSGHSVQESAVTIEEIKRILLLHLKENGLIDQSVRTKTIPAGKKP